MTDKATTPQRRVGMVFISYARADDAPAPHVENSVGWVTFFWGELRWALTTAGAPQAKLWLDRYQIDPADAFTPEIEAAVAQAKVIVPVFSENWLQSEWCRREVEHFGKTREDAPWRIIPVFKQEVPREKLTDLLQGDHAKEGYAFFERDPRGETRVFYWRKLEDEDRYGQLIRKIVDAIKERLAPEDLVPAAPAAEPAPATGRAVFLAACTKELRDARQRLHNDLVGAGITALPAIDDLPEQAAGYEAAIREALERADLALHILGDGRGMTPEGGSEPIVDLQLRLAREVARRRALPILLWAPRWLPDRPGQERRDPMAVALSFGREDGEEVLGQEPTDISRLVRERLTARREQPAAEGAARVIVVASATPEDDELVTDLCNAIQGHGPEIEPAYAGDPPPAVEASAVLVPWGAAERADLDRLLTLFPADAARFCLRLPGGDVAGKNRFVVKGVSAPRLDAVPSDPRAGRALLVSLELIEAAP